MARHFDVFEQKNEQNPQNFAGIENLNQEKSFQSKLFLVEINDAIFQYNFF